MSRCEQSKVKRVLFTQILTKVCRRAFMKTLENHTNLWKIIVPFEAQPTQNQTYFEIILRLNTYLKS